MKKKTNGERKQLLLILALSAAVVAASIFAFLQFYNTYIDGILYSERLSQMREVTTQLLSGLENGVDNQWLAVNAQCNYLQNASPQNAQRMVAFLKRQDQMNGFSDTGADIVSVDSQGGYYTQNGIQGMIKEMDYLLTDDLRISFVSKSMTDNGYGIDEPFLQHMFDPFTRAQDSTINKVQGTGLGMAITKNIVELMQGDIQVHSVVGQGSRFDVTLTLPIDANREQDVSFDTLLLLSSAVTKGWCAM